MASRTSARRDFGDARQLSWPRVGNHSEYWIVGDEWGWTSRLAVQEIERANLMDFADRPFENPEATSRGVWVVGVAVLSERADEQRKAMAYGRHGTFGS
ncbi:hypothetical protein AK812_SmicGene38829 [Symbiodinium microadriaticum]|uniref:Uncharacterized protein n=1 Tax=Symbiodinium microadriaticum TaxID=2951 RepID=A0A1Q9CCQ9_SYMMI|nr:hypothetical protein AK812_SmicGene38829 [Symbiodinium microadriaticum]